MGLDHMLIITLTLFYTGFQTSEQTSENTWEYWGKNGPENWPGICTTGKRQSPINIVTEDAIRIDLGALKFDQYDFAFSGTITNTGHTVEIRLDGLSLHLGGRCLPSKYILEQMHFHWSAEHTVDGLQDPLELHLVHYNKKYANFSEAVQHEDGIAVVAVLYELCRDDNPNLSTIVNATKMVSNWVGHMYRIGKQLIPLLLLPRDHTTYYHYKGSLTSPACQESVLWFVMTEKPKVSEAQIDVFRQIKSNDGMLKYNNRPIQNIGNRKVYHRLEGYSNSCLNITPTLLSVINILTIFHLVKLFNQVHLEIFS